jgi:hypothetical protein
MRARDFFAEAPWQPKVLIMDEPTRMRARDFFAEAPWGHLTPISPPLRRPKAR